MDLGEPTSYLTLSTGTAVYSSDGEKLGKVERVLAAPDLDIFDGLVIGAGHWGGTELFVDAAQVKEIFESGVELKISAAGSLYVVGEAKDAFEKGAIKNVKTIPSTKKRSLLDIFEF